MPQKTLITWIKATRPQFFTVIILPILLGTAIGNHLHGVFLPLYFALSLLAGILTHAAINVLNDYFDHLNKTDDLNHTLLTPFAGGSRMIQKGTTTNRNLSFWHVITDNRYQYWPKVLMLLSFPMVGKLLVKFGF